MSEVTIDAVASFPVCYYEAPERYTLNYFELTPLKEIYAACPIRNGKMQVLYSTIMEGQDTPVHAPNIIAPLMDVGADLSDLEQDIRCSILDALKPYSDIQRKHPELLQKSPCCAVVTLNIPRKCAGRADVQLYVCCFFNNDSGYNYTAAYYLHVTGQSYGAIAHIGITAPHLNFEQLQQIVLRHGKTIVRNSCRFPVKVGRTNSKQIGFSYVRGHNMDKLAFCYLLPVGSRIDGFHTDEIQQIIVICTPDDEGGFAVSYTLISEQLGVLPYEGFGFDVFPQASLCIEEIDAMLRVMIEVKLQCHTIGTLDRNCKQPILNFGLLSDGCDTLATTLKVECYCPRQGVYFVVLRLMYGKSDLGIIGARILHGARITLGELARRTRAMAEALMPDDLPALMKKMRQQYKKGE